jgi:hypothetical protein
MGAVPVIRAVALIVVAGCAQNLANGIPASGAPLSVDWQGYRQGGEPIDEQDFFRIAGDHDAADDIRSYRDHGVLESRIGVVLALIGASALVTFAADDDDHVREVAVPLILTLPIGGITAFIGGDRTHEEHVEPDWRAQEAADRYDAHLGVAP